jgi:hypothetical protein
MTCYGRVTLSCALFVLNSVHLARSSTHGLELRSPRDAVLRLSNDEHHHSAVGLPDQEGYADRNYLNPSCLTDADSLPTLTFCTGSGLRDEASAINPATCIPCTLAPESVGSALRIECDGDRTLGIVTHWGH